MKHLIIWFLCVHAAYAEPLKPVLTGKSWSLCSMPDLGELAGPQPKKQHIVDHGFLQRPDGKWTLWACLRGTKVGRVLWAWEGDSLEKGDWKSLGLAARADAAWGEKIGKDESIQAPHFMKHDGHFLCFYNSNGIRVMTSADGIHFTRRGQPPAGNLLYADGGRDVMALRIGDMFHAYSTISTADGRGYIMLRTSTDLVTWTPGINVCEGGQGGSGPVSTESPFVVPHDGAFYLFRASSEDGQTYVYRSSTPDNFRIGDDSKLVSILPLKAPEVIHHKGKWFISDLADFQHLRLHELTWNEG